MLGIPYDETSLESMSKKKLKITANSAAFTQLKELQKSHNKVKHIQYDTLEIQPYLKSNLFTSKEACMLTALRSK